MTLIGKVVKGILIGLIPIIFYTLGIGVTQSTLIGSICSSDEQDKAKIWAYTTLAVSGVFLLALLIVGCCTVTKPMDHHSLTIGYVSSIVAIAVLIILAYTI